MKIMKVKINIYCFAEIDGETFISVVEEDLQAAFSKIKDLEYQISQDSSECEINIFFQHEVGPVEEAANKFIDQIDMRDFLLDIEIYDIGGEDE